MIIIGIILLVFIFWRCSYFIFTPDLRTLDIVKISNLDEKTVLGLKTRSEIHKGEYHWGDTPWYSWYYKEEGCSSFLKEEYKKGAIYGGESYVYTSLEYGWKKKFNDYYARIYHSLTGPVTYNDNYIVFLFERGREWQLFLNSPAALSIGFNHDEPSILIYFMFNTAKIGWSDLIIVNRKTGRIKKKIRTSFVFTKAYLDESNKLYIRYGEEKSFFYQIK